MSASHPRTRIVGVPRAYFVCNLGCICSFTAAEELCGENQYLCSGCDTKVDASKRVTLHTLPRLLTLQLKRFAGSMGAVGGWGGLMGGA